MSDAVDRALAKKQPEMHHHEAPPGYRIKGVSTLRDADGNVKVSWVKTTAEPDKPEALLEAFKAAVDDKSLPVAAPTESPQGTDADLLTVYPMGDPHLGMLAWGPESGDDFDLDIAKGNLFAAVDRLVSLAPASSVGLIVNLGDFFHTDNASNTTSRSGNVLDADGRWAKILHIGVATMVRCIDRALERHETVRVINEIGNHDDHSSVMLSVCLAHHYHDVSRVEIDQSPAAFHWFEHGSCLLGVTHGHTAKMDKLPGIMACDRAEAWGRTRHRYWYTGHVHHQQVKEYPGCLVESFRTLAAKDAWHAAGGYRSGRSMCCDVLHRDRGRIMRHEVGVESL